MGKVTEKAEEIGQGLQRAGAAAESLNVPLEKVSSWFKF